MDSSRENCKRLRPEQEILEHYDWLSNLPTDILHHILSFLDATEVVKTRVLSKRWRHVWTSVPHLNFDYRSFSMQDPCLVLSYGECLLKFWEFVTWALIIRYTSPLYKLQLVCGHYENEHLLVLLSLSAMRSVEELHLLVGYELQHCPFRDPTFGIRQNFNGLVNLQFWGVFGHLKTLQLVKVRFRHPVIAEKLFSDCGILEELSVEYCSFMIKWLHISAYKLRKLQFVNEVRSRCSRDCTFEGELKVHTPNLESFCSIGLMIQPFEFSSDMPFLIHASVLFSLGIRSMGVPSELGTMVSAIHRAKELSFCLVLLFWWIKFQIKQPKVLEAQNDMRSIPKGF